MFDHEYEQWLDSLPTDPPTEPTADIYFWNHTITVIRVVGGGYRVQLHGDVGEAPLEYFTPHNDPYAAAALLQSEIDLWESEIIQLGEMIDAQF
jgi:hypothetical protein